MSTKVLHNIRSLAGTRKKRIALCDATDARILRAAREAMDEGIASIVLIGEPEILRSVADAEEIVLAGVDIMSPLEERQDLTRAYYEFRKAKLESAEAGMLEMRSNGLLYAALLARVGAVDGVLAGSLSTTGSVIRAALKGIGLRSGMSTLSSMFLMCFPAIRGARDHEIVLAFADGAVVPDPSSEELAEIAIATAHTFHTLSGVEPRVAMLSFSTHGSALSASTEKMKEAWELVRAKAPRLLVDGEMQFDAAFVPEVAMRKATGSPLAGLANVFIFPNLDAGNIGYKIAERLGMGQAIGPVLLGLDRPMNDLSRGASVIDIVNMIAITALQASDNV